MIVGLCILFFGNHAIALNLRASRFHGKTMKDIYVVGLPSIVMNAIGTLMTMAMNGILAGFSAVAVNVFGVYFKLQSFVFMPVFGLTQGAYADYGLQLRCAQQEACDGCGEDRLRDCAYY